MRKLVLWFTICLVMQVDPAIAQTINVGDSLPGVPVYQPAKKLILLEFWSINCIACIRSFPKLQALQDKFRNDIEIILVNREPGKKVEQLFAKRKDLFRPSLAFISGDTVLSMQFEGFAYPFHVWVGSDNIVLAITEAGYLTEDHVKSILEGNTTAGRYAKKKKLRSSLVQSGAGQWNAPVHYYSYLAGCSEVISAGNSSGAPFGEDKTRLSRDCSRLVELYKTAYSEKGKYNFFHPFTVNVNITDSLLLKEKFCYDLVVPSWRSPAIFDIMQQDLERYFGFKASVSRAYCKFVELLAMPGPDLLATKGQKPVHEVSRLDNEQMLHIKLVNQPFDLLVKTLQKHLPKTPMFLGDHSFYSETGNVDIDLVIDLEPVEFIERLRGELAKYNIRVYVQDIPMDVLTVTDK
jgi:thiol-disulfide isomerase/thioredoxin